MSTDLDPSDVCGKMKIPQKLLRDACLCFHLHAVVSGIPFGDEEEELKLSSSTKPTKADLWPPEAVHAVYAVYAVHAASATAGRRRSGLVRC